METEFSVDNVHPCGGQDTRKEGRKLEMFHEVKNER